MILTTATAVLTITALNSNDSRNYNNNHNNNKQMMIALHKRLYIMSCNIDSFAELQLMHARNYGNGHRDTPKICSNNAIAMPRITSKNNRNKTARINWNRQQCLIQHYEHFYLSWLNKEQKTKDMFKDKISNFQKQ